MLEVKTALLFISRRKAIQTSSPFLHCLLTAVGSIFCFNVFHSSYCSCTPPVLAYVTVGRSAGEWTSTDSSTLCKPCQDQVQMQTFSSVQLCRKLPSVLSLCRNHEHKLCPLALTEAKVSWQNSSSLLNVNLMQVHGDTRYPFSRLHFIPFPTVHIFNPLDFFFLTSLSSQQAFLQDAARFLAVPF